MFSYLSCILRLTCPDITTQRGLGLHVSITSQYGAHRHTSWLVKTIFQDQVCHINNKTIENGFPVRTLPRFRVVTSYSTGVQANTQKGKENLVSISGAEEGFCSYSHTISHHWQAVFSSLQFRVIVSWWDGSFGKSGWAKTDHLSSNPESHMVEEEKRPPQAVHWPYPPTTH